MSSRLFVPVLSAGVMLALASVRPLAQEPPSSGDAVIQAMHDRYAGKWYRTLTFVQRTSFPGRPDQTWYETAQVPGRLRIDIAPLDSQSTIFFMGDSTIRFHGGKRVGARPVGNVLLLLLADVFATPVEESVSRIRKYGFDFSRVSSGTFHGRRAWIVGAAAGDTTSSQFWIDAERLYVVRVITRAPDATVTDIHILGHRPEGTGWVERELHFYRNGVEFQGEYYSDVRWNAPVDPAVWNTATWVRPSWIP